ncbi:hypothetical protein [Robiginitalea sp.]|uniref:hypothetical protein n=1 Tax=Robiginitalea sp. TaxID=1902411 RepID=UPI003C78E7B0
MKCFVLFGLLLVSQGIWLQAQEDVQEYPGDNELKLNAAYLLGGFAEITYERILGEDSALGVSVGFALDNSIDYRFGTIPYYRLYFGNKRASGFFVEGNAAFFSERTFESETEFGGGLGLAIGSKFITKNNWIAEVFFGLGRNFANGDFQSDVYPRLGILIGKRF